MNTDASTAPVVKIEFDRETCGRCGGTGQMPFAAYGGVCLECHGKGSKLTRKGKAASARMAEWQAANMTVAITDLQPGDRVMMTNMSGARYAATVASVTPSPFKMWTGAGDDRAEVPLWSVDMNKGGGVDAPADHMMTRAWDSDSLTRCYTEALARMSGATATRKVDAA